MLEVENVYKNFGGILALNGVSFSVEPNSITGLIGPNGSGKSTLFNVISGFYNKDSGEIFLKGDKIEGIEPYSIAMLGIGRTFQISEVPEKMTVLENLLLAPKNQSGEGIFNVFLHPLTIRRENEKHLKNAYEILELIQLTHLKNEYAENLSGGQKKLLSLGRILMSEPLVLLLDEPTAGVNPTLVKDLMVAIKKLRDEKGITIILVEHNMKVISEICDRVIVLNFGKKIAEGTPEEIQQNEEVLEAYLSGSTKRELLHEDS
ncbi:MAG TPA: ABC transporter ATP-binding protein [Desulfatiglandales bacterium]|nr:ABC transporter ATP-binding protein [Desulfatiglandales bacterium]